MPDAPADHTASRYRFVVLALIMGVQTAANLGALGLPSLAPLIRADLALSRQEAGSFIPAFYIGGVLTSFPAGWLADRVGVRWTLLAGQGLVAACFALMTLTPGYGALMGAVLLGGFGFGAVNPTSTKGVLVWFPARSRATVVGLKQAGFPLGGALGALLLPSLAGRFGWRGALGIAGGLIGLSALMAGIGYREPARSSHYGVPGTPDGKPSFRLVLTSRPIWLVSLATLLFAAVQVSWISYVPLYLNEVAGLSAVAAGAILGQAQATGMLGRVVFGVVSDRVLGGRRRIVLVLTGGVTTVLCVLTAQVGLETGTAALSLLALTFGLTGIGWNGVHHTLLAEIAGRSSAATAVGLCLAVSSVGVILGAPLFGLVADRTSGYDWGWYALAAAMLVALVLLAGVREPREAAWRQRP